MRALKKVLDENPNGLTKADLDKVERWFDENGSAARAFEASLEATTVMRDDLLRVVAAVTAIANGGLTRKALLQAKLPKPHGRPIPESTINDVIDALMGLDTYVVKGAGR